MVDATRRRSTARAAILSAAADLIAAHGVAGTSISEIVNRSGTSAGAIYHHFGSKERLVLEVGRSAVAVPMTMIMATTEGLAPAGLFEAALDQVAKNENTADLLLQIWAGARSDPKLDELLRTEVAAMRSGVKMFVAAWCLEQGIGVDPAEIVDSMIGLVIGYAVQRGVGLSPDHERYRRSGARLISAACLGAATPLAGVQPPSAAKGAQPSPR